MPTSTGLRRLRMVNTVRAYRRDRRWSQEQLAVQAGISRNAVQDIENGAGCRDDLKLRLAEAFECNVSDLFWSEPVEGAA